MNQRHLAGSRRTTAERDRGMFQGRAKLRKYEEEKTMSETWHARLIQAEKKRWTLGASSKIMLLQGTNRLIPSRSDETVS